MSLLFKAFRNAYFMAEESQRGEHGGGLPALLGAL